MKLFIVGCGGFLGAATRYQLSLWISGRYGPEFPYATLFINLSGAFVLAFFMALALNKLEIDPLWRLFFTVGFLGAYTTFSTLEYETLNLVGDGEYWFAFLNLFGSSALGLIAVWLGNLCGKLL
jgi:fluoride exporter